MRFAVVTSATAQDDDGTGDAAGYRPVSRLAVAAVGLGAVSALALVSPAFWVLPLVGAAISIAALADVGRREAPKAGRLAAVAGLGLSLGFAAQAIAAAGTAEWLARSRAEAAVRFWIDAIVAGRLDDARSMCDPAVAGAVDRVAACASPTPVRVRCRGRDGSTGGRIVRATVSGCEFDVGLEAAPPRRPGEAERISIARCEAVTPSAN